MSTSPEHWKKGPIAWMAQHSIAANLLMVILILAGLLVGFLIKREVFPVFETDRVQVLVPYPGASPLEVEQGLVQPVEEALAEVDGIDEIVSVAKESVANVTIKALNGVSSNRLSRDIQSAVDRITTFPEDAEKPVVQVMSMHRRGLNVALYGNATERDLQTLAENFKDALLAHKEISKVKLDGIRPLELTIELDEFKLRKYGLTLPQVASIISQASGDTPSGSIKTKTGDTLIRVQHRRNDAQDFSKVPLIHLSRSPILLGDIANISDGYEDVDSAIRWNGQRCILIDINMEGASGPVEISDAVHGVMDEFKTKLPRGVTMDVLYDDSNSFKDRIDLLLRNAGLGLVLVFFMLSVLLRGRLAFWVTLGIPTSFLSALIFLPYFDVSINMVSLFAFIIALGIVVDDAVVVGENIYEWRQKGLSALEASIKGTQEVAIPVTFSILTNIAAFMPLAFVPGISGKIFKLIPSVVILIFIASWVESLFILPAHLAHGKVQQTSRSPLRKFSEGFSWLINTFFSPIVRWAVSYRYAMLSLAVCTLVLSLALLKSGFMGFSLFPIVESDRAIANVNYPFGTSPEKTLMALDRLRSSAEKVIKDLGKDEGADLGKGIIEILGKGNSGGHLGEVQVLLSEPQDREVSVSEFVKRWRAELGELHGVKSLVFAADRGGPGSGPALTFQVRGQDLKALERVNDEVINFLEAYSMVQDIEEGFADGKPQWDIQLKPAAYAMGLTVSDVSRQLRGFYTGSEALRQLRDRNEIKVQVKLIESQRQSINHLEETILLAPNGQTIPLLEAVELKQGVADTEINRFNGTRSITIQANVEPREQAGLIKAELQQNLIPELTKRYPSISFSFEGRQKDMVDGLKVLGLGFLLAVVVIYVLLAIPFNSYLQPVIIMFSIPFGIVGAVMGHLIMGYSLSIMSMFGIVALTGVVVNDSLVLIDLANRNMKGGMGAFDAVTTASVRRFRPIFLTSVTTFFGLAPMILETSPQARFLIPMAISLGFGIIFATVIALLIVPCLFIALKDLQKACNSILSLGSVNEVSPHLKNN